MWFSHNFSIVIFPYYHQCQTLKIFSKAQHIINYQLRSKAIFKCCQILDEKLEQVFRNIFDFFGACFNVCIYGKILLKIGKQQKISRFLKKYELMWWNSASFDFETKNVFNLLVCSICYINRGWVFEKKEQNKFYWQRPTYWFLVSEMTYEQSFSSAKY